MRDALKAVLALSIVGLLFSGYLSYYTLATGSPGCELFFFGLPSCFFGLILYALIFLLCVSILPSKAKNKEILAITLFSAIGILFAGYLTLYALGNLSCTSLEILGVPPCVYGLVMYLSILVLTLSASKIMK